MRIIGKKNTDSVPGSLLAFYQGAQLAKMTAVVVVTSLRLHLIRRRQLLISATICPIIITCGEKYRLGRSSTVFICIIFKET